ncbi:hypothetical protein Gpo141_00011851, partial [Globisporangium polare]
NRMLRTWFGKMTLLPAYQRMLTNKNIVFHQHVNSTSRYLLQKSDDSELKTIGCAGDRQLTASDGACTLKQCTTKSGATAPSEGCATVCNRQGHSATDASDCSSKCTCTDQAGSAEICWMLCVANLPTDTCAKSSQTCTGQAITCTSPTTAPSSGTPSPATTTTPQPTSAPTATSAPGTSAPSGTSSTPTTSAPSNSPSGSSPAATPGTSTTPKPASAASTSGSTSSDVKASNSSTAGSSPASATVTAPSSTTATPKSAAVGFSSAAVLVTSLAAFAHALFQ